MSDRVVIDGDLSIVFRLDGDFDITLQADGEPSNVVKISDYAYPVYTGPTQVTPSAETQTLSTTNKTVTADIIINPIPSNYGLITWNGSVLTVS